MRSIPPAQQKNVQCRNKTVLHVFFSSKFARTSSRCEILENKTFYAAFGMIYRRSVFKHTELKVVSHDGRRIES